MPVMVLDPDLAEEIIEGRNGFYRRHRREEVWDGVTYIMPEPDNEHSDLGTFLIWVFRTVFDPAEGNRVHNPCNVSDRDRGWKDNYRNPDVSVFLAGNPARDRRTHWFGGPDLAVEIISPDDRSRDKLGFYAKVGTGEVLVVDRYPWKLELYRRDNNEMKLVGRIRPGEGRKLVSAVVPFEFQLLRGRPRPKVKIIHTETGQEWQG